jgi:4-hydroxybenzoate polyprenyltransferase
MEDPNLVDDVESRLRFRRGTALHSYLELMRLPNVFTAMADVAMGFLFVQQINPKPGSAWPTWDVWTLATLIATSSLLYVAGVVLNDVFDLDIDRRERPERPLPSGRISPAAASRLGWNLLLGGVVLGSVAGFMAGHLRPGIVAALLATVILLYDSWLKRTPLGPLAMGACRFLNVMLGMNAVDASLHAEHWLVAGGIGVYVAGLTWFAQRESERSSRPHLVFGTSVMILGLALLAWFPQWTNHTIDDLRREPQKWHLLIAALGLIIVWRCLWAVIEPVPARVRMAVAQCVLSLIMLDAVACYAVRGVFWAGMILLLLIPAVFLGRWIETT